jgi:hypothetical protein
LDDLPGDNVGVDHRNSTLAQQAGGRGFAHADPSG